MTETGPAFRLRTLRSATVALAAAWILLSAWPVLAAGPLYWDFPAGDPFSTCQMNGVRVTAEGYLAPGLPREPGLPLDVDIVWTMVPDGTGGYLLGTGHDGRILRLDADGRTTVLADLDVEEVLSLVSLPDGRLVAGCEPDGRIFIVEAGGDARAVGKLPDGYVWAMVADGSERVYLAVGSPARIMLLDTASGELTELRDFPAENAIDVLRQDSGRLLVSTQGPGLVYGLDPGRPDEVEILLQAPQDEVGSLMVGPGGEIYGLALDDGYTENKDQSSTSPGAKAPRQPRPVIVLPGDKDGGGDQGPARAALYALTGEHAPQRVWSGDLDLMAAAWLEGVGWVAGGLRGDDSALTTLYHLLPGGGRETLANWGGGDITALAARGGELRVAQTRTCVIDHFEVGGQGPRMVTGPVLDASRPVVWGRLSWRGYPRGVDPRWSVRTGNRETPDANWTGWSSTWRDADHALDAPAARFLQWRVELPASVGGDFRLTSVTVSAYGENRPPVISELRRERLTGVRQGGLMLQRPNVTRTFAGGLKAEFNRREDPKSPEPALRSRLGRGVVVFTWSVEDPDGDALDYKLECRSEGGTRWLPVAEGADQKLGTWNTEDVPDGTYTVRLTVSDEPDNPGDRALSSERGYGPITVDNTAPEITGLKAAWNDGRLHLVFTAQDGTSPVGRAYLVLDEDRRIPLEPRDRICDSLREEFTVDRSLDGTDEVPATVLVEVVDTAGNLASRRSAVVRK